MKKLTIEFRHICGERGIIKRQLYVDQVGNFNRVTCRYAKKIYLVHSEEGDLGDPFRVEKKYFESLFINTWQPLNEYK